MLPADLQQAWLDGQSVDVVAPGLRLDRLAEAVGRAVLVITPDDGTALLAASSVGAVPILRWTSTVERNRALRGPVVVTSLDSLHVPSLRSLTATELANAPRVLLGACQLDDRLPGHLGRAAFEEDLLGRARLRVHSLRATAPDAVVIESTDGVVLVAEDAAERMARSGGGVVLGELPGLVDAAHRHGLPIRRHGLRRPFARAWLTASAALRTPARGFDVLEELDALPVVGSAPLFAGGPFRGAFVAGGALLQGGGAHPAQDAGDARLVLDRVEAGGAWAVLPSATPGVEDLAAIGVLGRLRPVWSVARVADAKRFRSPFTDREPAWTAMADRYAEALRRWSLEERTRLALSDQSPRDLPELARALGTDAAALCDVLMDLNAADIVAVRTEASAGAWDVQVRRGRSWGIAGDDAAAAVQLLAGRRAALQEVLGETFAGGCTTQGWRSLTTGTGGPVCGVCAHCDPEATTALSGSERAGPSDAAQRPAQPSLDGLFGRLDARPTRPAATDPVELARSGRPEDRERAQVIAGSAGALYLMGLYRHSAPPGEAALPIPAPVTSALLDALTQTALPNPGEAPDAPARSGRSGTWTVEVGAGLWRFVPRPSVGGWESDALGTLSVNDPELTGLALARRSQAAWVAATRDLQARLERWLAAHAGLPTPAHLADLLGVDLPDPHVAWAPVFNAFTALASGKLVDAELPPGTARRPLDVLRAMVGQDDAWLAREGRAVLDARQAPLVADRLLLRCLLVLRPALTAEHLVRWLALPEPPADPGLLLDRLDGGRRGSFAQLAVELPEHREQVVARAVALRRLPRELLDEALEAAVDAAGQAAALVAATPAPERARRVWDRARGHIDVDQHAALAAALDALDGGGAAALAALVHAEAAARAERAQERESIVALADAGKIGEAATRLAALAEDPESTEAELAAFAAIRERAIARQRELVVPIVAALAGTGGPDADDAAFGALEEAVQEGFGDAVVALLARQHRRAPDDQTRALWLARALALNGDWAEARRVYAVAAREHADPRKRVETEFEGVFLALDEGKTKIGLAWIEELLDTPWHQLLAPHIASLIDDAMVPAGARSQLADLLEATRSPFYAKDVRRLRT